MKYYQSIFCTHPSALVIDWPLYHLQYKVNHQKTYSTILQQFCSFSAKINNLQFQIATSIRREPFHETLDRCTFTHCVFVQSTPASRRKASFPTVKNAIHKKQSSYIFHCLYEWTRRSPMEEKKMAAHAQLAWWRHQILCELFQNINTHCEGIAKVFWWVAVTVVLHRVYQKDFINK